MKKKRLFMLTLTAVLAAQATAINFLEGFIPALPVMPPGAKPGFSNIVTMFAAGSLGLPYALGIAAVKSLFVFATRGITAFAMSFAGGVLSAFAMWLLSKYCRNALGLIGISVISSLCHNAGQLLMSAAMTGSSKTLYYAPALAVFGVVTGIITGLIFRVVLPALEKQKNFFTVNK